MNEPTPGDRPPDPRSPGPDAVDHARDLTTTAVVEPDAVDHARDLTTTAVVGLRVIVCDDDPLARRVVRDALQRAGIVVVAEAHDGREALELTRHYRPDVLLIDVVMPGIDGIETTREATRTVPTTKVIVLTSYDDDDLGLLALRAGASGFLTKTDDVDRLPAALHSALHDEAVVSPHLTLRLVEHLRRAREDTTGMRPVTSPLTDREWEVLDLLCQQRTTDEIADHLVLSTETVRSHIKNLLRKFGVSSRRDAVDIATTIRNELLTTPDPQA